MPAPRSVAPLLLAALLLAGPAARAQTADEPANDPRVRAVAKQLLCYCGCPTQTVADCTCGVAREEQQKIQASLDTGSSPDEIVAAWVDEHGPQVLAELPPKGFNLVGWLLPSALLLVAAGLLLIWLRAGARSRPATAAAGSAGAPDPRYLDQLREELDRLDR